MGTLAGKTAVVLGASGEANFGSAIARRLSAEGANVVVSARRQQPLDSLAADINGLAVACDVTEPDQVAALYRAATERLGQVDILVNNAGIADSAPLKSITLESWNLIMAVNATGTFLCTQIFLPSMVERGRGRLDHPS